MERKNAWLQYTEEEKEAIHKLGEQYKDFLNKGKTERECVKEAIVLAEKNGYRDLTEIRKQGYQVKAGDKIYAQCMGKALALFHIGREPMENGLNILGAHIDSPRLDIKQNPLYEDTEMALLDTHYYGGVKKYQWVALPLALHGVVAKKDGTVQEIVIGEDPADPVVGITDLLIHLAGDQLDKKARTVIEGENLDILIGSQPLVLKEQPSGISNGYSAGNKEEDAEAKKNGKDKVVSYILQILKDRYGMEEEDFLSAEIEAVPAGPARDFGLDCSMIMGYGHDDRICAYTSLSAMLESQGLRKTGVCLLVDKEEVGSMGATGMQSRFFENTLAELMDLAGQYSELALRRALAASRMLSSDVSAAYDPNFSNVFEKKNTAYFGRGMVFNKYTGARGKSGSNDASAEYMAALRKIMDDNQIAWQTAELGKVDQGGGGTIAYITANYGMEVIDSGIAVLNMHAPWEIGSKADIYEAAKGYAAFLREA